MHRWTAFLLFPLPIQQLNLMSFADGLTISIRLARGKVITMDTTDKT